MLAFAYTFLFVVLYGFLFLVGAPPLGGGGGQGDGLIHNAHEFDMRR